jgi:hypothetical protein
LSGPRPAAASPCSGRPVPRHDRIAPARPDGVCKSPFHVIGPVGTRTLMAGLEEADAADIKI